MKKPLKTIEFECPLGVDHQVHRIRNAVWAFLVLLGISALLSIIVLFLGVRIVQDNNQKFCQVLETVIPVVKPADPKAQPDQQKAWVHYQRVLDLTRDFGCVPPR